MDIISVDSMCEHHKKLNLSNLFRSLRSRFYLKNKYLVFQHKSRIYKSYLIYLQKMSNTIIYQPLGYEENGLLICLVCFDNLIKYISSLYFTKYSEFDSSGSVTKLTTRVSLKRKFGETKLH